MPPKPSCRLTDCFGYGMAPLPPVRGVDEPEVVRGLEIGEGDILPFRYCGDLEFNKGLPTGETGHDTFRGIWISLGFKINHNKKR